MPKKRKGHRQDKHTRIEKVIDGIYCLFLGAGLRPMNSSEAVEKDKFGGFGSSAGFVFGVYSMGESLSRFVWTKR